MRGLKTIQLLVAWRGKKRRGVEPKTTPQPHSGLSPGAKSRAKHLVGGEKEMLQTAMAMYRQHFSNCITPRPSLAIEPIFSSGNDFDKRKSRMNTEPRKLCHIFLCWLGKRANSMTCAGDMTFGPRLAKLAMLCHEA